MEEKRLSITPLLHYSGCLRALCLYSNKNPINHFHPASTIHFSVSVIPFTNCFCINITTSTGGIIASMADAIMIFHSA